MISFDAPFRAHCSQDFYVHHIIVYDQNKGVLLLVLNELLMLLTTLILLIIIFIVVDCASSTPHLQQIIWIANRLKILLIIFL